jgi:histidine triad (HIT) family protein
MDIFCDIVANQDARPYLYEDDNLIIINSRYPAAEKHFLVIPKKHIESVMTAENADAEIIGKLIVAAKEYTAGQGIKDYKLVFNAGKYLEVKHLHLHILCGEMKGL